MRYEKLFEPVSEDEPCGPDLDEADDEDYLNYTLTAEERIPGRFFDADTGAPFDKSEIDLKSEVKQISKLLKASRDIRLLCLEARFQCLAGEIIGFCECVQTISGLVERYWETVHPVATDDDLTMRQNTLEVLASRVTVLLPLQFATLVNDKRHGPIIYRDHAVSQGEINPREGEMNLDSSTINGALSDSVNEPVVTELHSVLTTTLESLESIREAFVENSGFDYAPSFSDLVDSLKQIRKLLEIGQPALSGDDPDDEEGGTEGDGSDGPAPEGGGGKSAPSTLSDGTQITISSPEAAIEALMAAETYFSSSEPSSPAVILVHQARQLVGKPLVDALQALLPEMAEKAVIKLNPATRFELGIASMRILSESAASGSSGSTGSGNFIGPRQDDKPLVARTRHDATALIMAAEAYFKITEPSSPVPLLLSKARGYLSKDFNSIINDIIDTST